MLLLFARFLGFWFLSSCVLAFLLGCMFDKEEN